jgi:hypothetical protein
MNKLFARMNLPRCHNDWCTKVIIMQYLQNYRKNLRRSKNAAARAIEDLPNADKLEKQFLDKAATTKNRFSLDKPDKDNRWVDKDNLNAAAATSSTDDGNAPDGGVGTNDIECCVGPHDG